MSKKELPQRPSWEQLQTQAKERLRTARIADPEVRLHAAQRELAEEYGFASWASAGRP